MFVLAVIDEFLRRNGFACNSAHNQAPADASPSKTPRGVFQQLARVEDLRSIRTPQPASSGLMKTLATPSHHGSSTSPVLIPPVCTPKLPITSSAVSYSSISTTAPVQRLLDSEAPCKRARLTPLHSDRGGIKCQWIDDLMTVSSPWKYSLW